MVQLIEIAIPLITFLLMLVVGFDVTPADFDRVRRQKAVLAAGLVGPVVILPPIAVLLITLLSPPPEIAAGLLLIAACPVGGISTVYSYLARASTALSVALTAVSCLAAAATIPLIAHVFQLALGRPFGVVVPWHVLVAQLLAVILAPVALGMVVRRRAPAWTARHDRQLRTTGFVALGLLIALVIANQRDEFLSNLKGMLAVAVLMIIAAMAAGFTVALAAGAGARDRFTLSVEFATRNVAIATAIAVTLLGQIQFAVFATTYFLVEIPIMLAAIAAFRRAAPAISSVVSE
jgi:BASS family bile acid:Na+ symporter